MSFDPPRMGVSSQDAVLGHPVFQMRQPEWDGRVETVEAVALPLPLRVDSRPMPDPEPVAPMIVTVPETRGSGTGGTVTSTGHPVHIHTVAPWKIISVRAAKAGIDTLLGSLTGSTAGAIVGLGEFQHLLLIGLGMSVSAVVVNALRNTYEYLNQWDQKHPTFTA